MPAPRLIVWLLAGWGLCLAASIAHPYVTAPSGDGFVRGMNLLAIFMFWQIAALIVAVVLLVVRLMRPEHLTPALRWAAQIPLILTVIAILSFTGYFYYAG